jgi:hypothetical protein
MKNIFLGLLGMIWACAIHLFMTYVSCTFFTLTLYFFLSKTISTDVLIFGLQLTALWYGVFLLVFHFKQNLTVK